jgi:hypothetical protein
MPQTIGIEASRATLPRSSESIAALAATLINPEKSLTAIIRSGRVGRSIEVLEDGGDRPRTMALFPEDHCEGLLPDASIVRLKLSQLRLSRSWQRYCPRAQRRLLAYEQAVFDHPAGARVHLAAQSPSGHPHLVLQARRGRLI